LIGHEKSAVRHLHYRLIQTSMKKNVILLLGILLWGCSKKEEKNPVLKIPLVVITDLYHPYQDPGDNLDLINGFALPDVDLQAVILDITDAFRKDTADHPWLWHDPNGPREAGFIPVAQLNYIFNRNIPCASGPMTPMKTEMDKMENFSMYEQQGIDLLMKVLKESRVPVQILSFGSARVLAVAYNRNPDLMKQKIKRIHLCAGTAAQDVERGKDAGANLIPGWEWNVALDVFAFTRLLRSGLPIALYPCAGKDGAFVKDVNNTYWRMGKMDFLKEMSPRLQCYLDYAFHKRLQHDFLRAMDKGAPFTEDRASYMDQFHFWETAVWLKATNRELVKEDKGGYRIKKQRDVRSTDRILENSLRPCTLKVQDDGRFQFSYTDKPSNISIYFRPDTAENEIALNEAVPLLFCSYDQKQE
jgi:pyrimidine-specific ribonucleoside hydrolase